MAKLTPEDRAKIVELYNSGMTQQQIADQYSVSRSAISLILIKARVETRPGNESSLDEDDIRQISEMYNRGMTQQQIADQYSAGQSTIFKILKK